MNKKINILLADDHIMVRKGLMFMLDLQNEFKVNITEAVNGLEVLEKLKHDTFDVILLDINMPELDGMGVLKRMKSLEIKTPVLMLTMHNEENIIRQAFDFGAWGYILKNSGIEELVKAISTLLKNQKYYSNEIAQILFDSKKKAENIKNGNSKFAPLSDREAEILSLIVTEKSNQDIANSLSLSKRTIEGHRQNIMSKLKIKTTVGLVVYALKMA